MLGLVTKAQNTRAEDDIITMFKDFVVQVTNGATTLSLMALSITAYSVVLLSITIKTMLSITALNTVMLSIIYAD